jgi:hypothetical protein
MGRALCCWFAAFLLATSGFGQAPGYLRVTVIQGGGAFNDIKHGIGHPPAVEVRDENNQPVSGAEVVFTFPAVGAGGTFANGQRVATVTTDAQGVAQAGEFRPNLIEGRFNIMVTARSGGKEGSIGIVQSNTAAGAVTSSKGSKKKWIIIAIIGGAGAGAAFGLKGGSSSSSGGGPTATTLSTGTITVGAPR